MAKPATFGVMHLGIAFGASYVRTGRVAIAGAITRIEPIANTVARHFCDRWWERRRAHAQRRGAAASGRRPLAGAAP